METKLTFRYDGIGDIMYVDKCRPYAEQDSYMLENDVAVRTNPETNEVETVEILFFKRRIDAGEEIALPLDANLRLAVEA